ncbi:MAG: CvpA family protein [Oscillospiraceae bacterium]|nr:CvpA family protein [Oscillospiraceae bacterium]
MIGLIIDIVLIAIVVFCAWRGFRAGLITSIIGVVAVVVAIYGANLIAATYSGEFVGMTEPFVSGLVDSVETKIMGYTPSAEEEDNETQDSNTFVPVLPVLGEDAKNVLKVCTSVLRQMGLAPEIADRIASDVDDSVDTVSAGMNAQLTTALCEKLCFIGVFIVAFLLIMIIFTAIGNVLDLVFGLPGLENINHILGGLLGAVKGAAIVIVICCVLRYLGIVLTPAVLDSTFITKRLMESNLVADILKI